MNKIIISLALALTAGASSSAAQTAAEKQTTVAKQQPARLTSQADSLSYSAGQMLTMGMMDYVMQQLKVDRAYTADFNEALRNGLAQPDTPQAKARAAGEQVASMVKNNMIPNIKKELESSDIKFNEQLFLRGFIDAVSKDTTVFTVEGANEYHRGVMDGIKERKAEALRAEGKAWLAENAKQPGVVTMPSGLQYKVVRKGSGPIAQDDAEVTVKYEGRLIDGTVFDSSYKRNPQTTSFRPSQVIKGWTEALHLMPEGSEWEIYIPEHLGYGERQAGKIPPYSTLIFKLEVVKVGK